MTIIDLIHCESNIYCFTINICARFEISPWEYNFVKHFAIKCLLYETLKIKLIINVNLVTTVGSLI